MSEHSRRAPFQERLVRPIDIRLPPNLPPHLAAAFEKSRPTIAMGEATVLACLLCEWTNMLDMKREANEPPVAAAAPPPPLRAADKRKPYFTRRFLKREPAPAVVVMVRDVGVEERIRAALARQQPSAHHPLPSPSPSSQ